MRTSLRHRQATAAATAALLLLGSLGSASALATGTCAGNKTEVVIPSETRTESPLLVYDRNGDGIVCSGGGLKKTQYGDNRI